MANLTKLQQAGLDLLDRVVQNQLLVDLHYSQAERDALQGIAARARALAVEAGLDGLPLERAVHWSLALVEYHAADSDAELSDKAGMPMDQSLERASNYLRNLGMAATLALAGKVDGVDDIICSAVEELVDDVARMPATVRHRLAERVFAVEYPNAPLEVLAWLCETEVVAPAKFLGGRDLRSLAPVSLRAASLWELDGVREWITLLRKPKPDGSARADSSDAGNTFAPWLSTVLRQGEMSASPLAVKRVGTLMSKYQARAGTPQARTCQLLDTEGWGDAERVRTTLCSLSGHVYWDRGVVTSRDQTASPIAALMLAKAVLAQPDRAVINGGADTPLAQEVVEKLEEYGLTLSADTVYRTYGGRHKTNMERAALHYRMLQAANTAYPFDVSCPYQFWTAVISDMAACSSR